MSGITSVQTVSDMPNRTAIAILAVLGLLAIIDGLSRSALGQVGQVGFGLFAIALAVGIYYYQKPKCVLILGTVGSDKEALSSGDQAYIRRVAHAINEALVARG